MKNRKHMPRIFLYLMTVILLFSLCACGKSFLTWPAGMGASQWDGVYDSIAENGMAVYIFMAENDEYYGSRKARDAYAGLYEAYQSAGWAEEQIDRVLQLEIPDNEYFNSRGIYNYHGGGNILFDDESILNWIISQRK